ncbi:MAG: extracellular solute-binding protein [Chloroflexi bacterium]|nr:MAG: extracellular solute-binding protein [Chloroflexota bacterium]
MKQSKILRPGLSRRQFLQSVGGLAALLALPRETVFRRPTRQLSGTLRILQWSHFVPRYDEWFDEFAVAWGNEVGVEVIVDHVGLTDLVPRTVAEINAGEGHDLIEHIAPVPQFEPSVISLNDLNAEAVNRFGDRVGLSTRASFNPVTDNFHSYCHGWVPDVGDYRKSLWAEVGKEDGPATWQDLIDFGAPIRDDLGVQMGIGMSNEIDSNMAARALIWSFGGSVQDEDANVTINSPETVAAVAFMKELFEKAMTPEVFSWQAASNNQLLIAGQASYILNSISAYRSAQQVNPEVADDIFFTPALTGPDGIGLASEHVIYNYIVPTHAENPDAAMEFLLHLTENYDQAVFNSELYNFPSYFSTTPDLLEGENWVGDDPFGSNPPDKLAVLGTAEEWSTVVGHPGPANAAVGEVFATFILPEMMAKAARGDLTPEEAVAEAEERIIPIFEKWRDEGLI